MVSFHSKTIGFTDWFLVVVTVIGKKMIVKSHACSRSDVDTLSQVLGSPSAQLNDDSIIVCENITFGLVVISLENGCRVL